MFARVRPRANLHNGQLQATEKEGASKWLEKFHELARAGARCALFQSVWWVHTEVREREYAPHPKLALHVQIKIDDDVCLSTHCVQSRPRTES